MKKRYRHLLDAGMAVLLILLQCYQAVGNLFHEIAGVLLLLLFVIHNLINWKWYRSLPKGKYSVYRKVLLAANLLALAAMLAAMGTGIYMSQSVFAPFLGMREGYLIRPFHVAAAAWGILLVSIHAGMHIRLPEKKSPLFVGAGLVLAVCGIWAFVWLDMPSRLMFRDMGMYWSGPGILLFLANGVVMVLFAGLAAIAAGCMKRKQ